MNLAHAIVHGHTAYDLGEADAKRFAAVFNSIERLVARVPEILGTHYDIAYPGEQLRTARDLRIFSLDAEYRAAGAHTGQFHGWACPLCFLKTSEPLLGFGRQDWFDNVAREVRPTHESAAIFNVSSFGNIEVKGPDAEAFLLKTCAGFLSRPVGSVIYSAVLNDLGTFESDITAQRIAEDHYRMFVGSTAIKRDLAWFRRHLAGFDATLTDSTEDFAVLALMGSEASGIVTACGAPEKNPLKHFHFT